METEADQKVYVAIGTSDLFDSFSTLQWALRKWPNQAISIVILHAPDSLCRDYIYTLLGKLPVSSVCEEKLKVIEKAEEVKNDKILSQYIAFCSRVGVEAQVQKFEKNDEQPIHKQIAEMISTLQITKLVVSLTFMKSTSGKSRSPIRGSFYVLHQKPDFCKLFLISEGRLVFLRGENDEGIIEDEKGVMVPKLKEKNRSIRNWIGKMFTENNAVLSSSLHQWEKCCEEIEQYANQLLSLSEDSGDVSVSNVAFKENSTELDMLENMDVAERILVLEHRIQSAQDEILLKRKEADGAKAGLQKAQWAINMCNARVDELESCKNEELMKTADLKKELEYRKEEKNELAREVDKITSKLKLILEFHKELSNKLQLSSSAKSHGKFRLANTRKEGTDIVLEIGGLREQWNLLQHRIEFCRAMGNDIGLNLNVLDFDYREFTAAQVRAATDNFSQQLRLNSAGQSNKVYRGRINHIMVAVKMYDPANELSPEAFAAKEKFLNQVRHPNLLCMIGICSELHCIIYEYMNNGSLHDALFSTQSSSMKKNRALSWHARISIAAEICSALGFLHNAKPLPLIHGNLNPSKILLDQNNVAKLNGLKATSSHGINPDIWAFGNLVLQLLTGHNWDIRMDGTTVIGHLDYLAGDWPVDLVKVLCKIAMCCLSYKKGLVEESITEMPVREINDIKKKADQLISDREFSVTIKKGVDVEDLRNVPSAFLCPIYQDVMQNPHIAADGFSYEFEAIDGWLQRGRDTSPMTNLRLKHTILTPNHTLHSLIQDWQIKRSAALT